MRFTLEQWVNQRRAKDYHDLIEEIESTATHVVCTCRRVKDGTLAFREKILRSQEFGDLQEMVGNLPENFRPDQPSVLTLLVWAEELVAILTPVTVTDG